MKSKLQRMKVLKYICLTAGLALLAACNDADEITSAQSDSLSEIRIAEVSADAMASTAAATRTSVAAESLTWLKEGLAQGMDITYFIGSSSQKAQLKLEVDESGVVQTSSEGYTLYSLNTYDADGTLTSVPAKWLNNGAHTFQGVYIPEGLLSQNTTQAYDDLSQYTAIPPKTKISATVASITLPLQHRLARVVAYVLIDPSMSTTLKGYNAANYNADSTQLHFCNVKMLSYVGADGCPVWKEVRKTAPNFLGERGSVSGDGVEAFETFRMYKSVSTGAYIFPTDDEWAAAHADYVANGATNYTCTDYGLVPCYDLIVRPTYSDTTLIMYDEETLTADEDNGIDFELTLANDLEYEKQFTFDLNANDETVVYLRVTPERIDYNSAGAQLWKESSYADAYYGVNNQNGNNLSVAGSSWQRAYTNATLGVGVTDGHFYDTDAEDAEAQYVGDSLWIAMLLQSCEGGAHHGDYFLLDQDLEINTDLFTFPDSMVFTGHLDALDHTITLSGSRGYLFDGLNGTYVTAQESDASATWEANVHLEGSTWVPTSGWRAEVVNTVVTGGLLFKSEATVTGYVSNCEDANGTVTNHTPTIPTY